MDDVGAKSKVAKILLSLISGALYLISFFILWCLISYQFELQQPYQELLALAEIYFYFQGAIVALFILVIFFSWSFVSNMFKTLCSLPLMAFTFNVFYFVN